MYKATPVLDDSHLYQLYTVKTTLVSTTFLNLSIQTMSYVFYKVFVIFFVMFKLTSRRFHQSNQLPFIKIIKLIK